MRHLRVHLIIITALIILLSACTAAPGMPSSGMASASESSLLSGTSTPTVEKEVSASGEVSLGSFRNNGFTLVLPSDAYEGVADIKLNLGSAGNAPEMQNAMMLGGAYNVDTGGTGRLDNAAMLTYQYDPAKTTDPMLLALGYFDGQEWTYIPAESVDENAHTVSFHIYHFSAYYPSEFKSELDAAKHYSAQMAAHNVLGQGGGDPKTVSRSLSDYMADKLGLGDNEFSRRMLADIAADQDIMKSVDECQQDGWSDKAYEKVMGAVCNKIADSLTENRSGLTAKEGVVLTLGEEALKKMGEFIKATSSGSKILGYISEGDMKDAGIELYNFATDNTGVPGKVIKYTLSGMQNALDVWRDGEVENAFQVYSKGGGRFGYDAKNASEFDAIWDNMKAASRQLCKERIDKENEARKTCGMEPLSAKEEDFYRQKVKEELKNEFDRRVSLQDKIDNEKKNLDLIFTELDKSKMLESTNVWIRNSGDPNETLESRLNRFEHLIQRIYKDLNVNEVYSGQQLTGELNGRISAAAMAEMVRGYFAAKTQVEAEQFIQDYYKRFDLPLTNMSLAGKYLVTYDQGGQGEHTIIPDGATGGIIELGAGQANYTFSGDTLTYQTIDDRGAGGRFENNYTIKFTKAGGKITGKGICQGGVLMQNGESQDWTDSFTVVKIN